MSDRARTTAPDRRDRARTAAPELRAGAHTIELGRRPLLMGVLNASPDSFSDLPGAATLAQQLVRAQELVRAGADMLDVGGESARTDTAPVAPEQEIERVVPLIEGIVGELGAIVSVDTYKPPVARAAIAAGACIVNDVSGLREPELAEICAATGAALVIMHTGAPPKQRMQDPAMYVDVGAEVQAFLAERMAAAISAGVRQEQIILDPGPDFAKTPAQTVQLLAGIERLHALGRPLLMAISRKDFVGALTGRPPRERLAGTLAALAHGVQAGAQIFRLHDIQAASDFLRVRDALAGNLAVDPELELHEDLRHIESARTRKRRSGR
jgi:dihydropteroate synthase